MATPQQINDIAGLYVAYFDRAPDPAGLQFWIDQLDGGRDFATISQDFAESEEAKEIYPFLATPDLVANSPAAFVTSIYANLFGRAPDAAGLNFWVDVLGNGEVAPGDMVEAIMLGAQDTLVNGGLIQDKTTVENKIECALAFSTEAAAAEGFVFNDEAYSAARQSIEGVDATDASVVTAKAATFQYFSEFVNTETFTLCDIKVLVSPEEVEETFLTETVLYWGYNPHSHDETDGVDNLDGNNPDGNDNNLTNEGPEDGGIPADAFFGHYEGTVFVPGYLQSIAGADLVEILGIDVDSEQNNLPDFTNVRDITVTAGDGGSGVISFVYPDGTSDDIAVAAEYFDLLSSLILDEEGNSRFFEKEVATQVAVVWVPELDGGTPPQPIPGQGEYVVDPLANEGTAGFVGYVDAVITKTTDAVYASVPIVLTPTENNGGTKENGFTTAADDLIQVGQLDLLHGAILDGGLGYNTLEIDAKGHFAQPKSLENIQQVTIQNLPNIYTGDEIGAASGQDNANQYPDVIEPGDPDYLPGAAASVIDLTRATDLENVTITDGYYDYLDSYASSVSGGYGGGIEVVGLRNGATLTLDGDYYQDVFVQTASNTAADGFTIILNNVSAESNLYVADNTTQLNLVSQGGGNHLDGLIEYSNASVSDLVISGGAHLFIENDLNSIFENDTPATIDASANTGGVDLNISGPEQLTFLGSKANDRLAVNTSGSTNTQQGPDYGDDQEVTVVNTDGDNYYDIETHNLTLTDGDGDNNIELDVEFTANVTAGGGDNYLQAETQHLTATFGDGDNRINLQLNDEGSSGDANPVGVEQTEVGADINLGDGANYVVVTTGDDVDETTGDTVGRWEVDFPEINITAGDGGNTILLPGLPVGGDGSDSYKALTQVDITTGDGDDTILVAASSATIASNGGNDTITLLGVDNDYVTEVYHNKSVDLALAENTSFIEITGGEIDDAGVDAFVYYSVNGIMHSAEVYLGSADTSDANDIANFLANWFNGSGGSSAGVIGNGISAEVVGNGVVVSSTGLDIIRVEQVNFDGTNQPAADVSVGDFAGSGYGGSAGDFSYNYKGFTPSIYGITLDVDTGSGSATINLGDFNNNLAEVTGAIVAKEGSSITGSDITLFVNTDADLRAASLTGVTAVIMDDDNRIYGGQGFSSGNNNASGAASLTLLDSQVTQLLTDGVDFSTQGETFGAQSVLTIIITGDTSLSDLIDLSTWNDSIKLCFVVSDGATLTMTAEELHTYVAPEGIAVDEGNGYIDNQIVITDAGLGFDPFNDQNGGSGGGTISGSLSNQDISIEVSTDGYARPGQDTSNATITINSDETPVVAEDIVALIAKELVITGDADLEISGKVDLADDFTIDFSDFNGNFQTNADGAQVAMTIYNFQDITGDVNDPLRDPNDGDTNVNEIPTDPYSWGRIDGNGTSDDPVRINIVLGDGTVVGDCDWGPAKGGFNSSGVQQYVLTDFVDENDYLVPQAIGGSATIVVCDHTEDLEVLGLQNNRNSDVTFEQVNWGTEILMEGDGYANASDQEKNLGDPDLSEVGHVTANFFEAGANAFVRITNQGVELGQNEDAEDGYDPAGERKLIVDGIVVNNADRLRIDVEDGDAVIKNVTGIDVERVIVNGAEDVELRIDCVADIEAMADAKGNEFAVYDPTNPTNPYNVEGFDTDDLKSIDGTGVAGEFKLTFDGSGTGVQGMMDDPTFTGTGTPPQVPEVDAWGNPVYDNKIVDLSGVVLTAVDAIELAGNNIQLIMTAQQVLDFGGIITTTGDNSTLDVVDLSDQALDLTSLDVDNIGNVALAEGDFTLDAATDFGGADALVMNADGDDLTATMTLDQLQTVSGSATLTLGDPAMSVNVSQPKVCFDEDNGGDAKLILTGVEGDDQIDTSNFVGGTGDVLDVEIRGSDFVATDKFAILPDDTVNTGDPADTVFIHVILEGGTNDVTDVPLVQLYGLDCLTLEGGAVLDITAAQLAILMSKTPQEIKVADGETATINIVDLYDDVVSDTGATNFDLNALVEANPGLNIGTISILDTDNSTTEDFTGTYGTGLPLFTFGGADEIITPTGGANSPEFGIESTVVTITANQFHDLDGIGFISGGSVVNIEDLANTIDGGDTGADPDSLGVDKPDTDTVEIDTSGITARKGTLTLIEVGALTTTNGEAVFLTDTSDISGFETILTDGQLIGFATEAQASGAAVTEAASTTTSGNPTGIVWCFETWSGTEIDTSNYDPDINTLFVYDTLVDGQNEEAIWTYLPGSIDVQKFNDAIPIGLAVINRVNIFEPFTTAPNGITFDDTDGQQTIGQLTLILEGNVLLGDVTIADSVGDGDFEGITINSTFDAENNPGDSNVIIQENEVGDIVLNAPMAANTVLEVLLNASDDQPDASFANGTGGTGSDPSGTDVDAGNDLVTGTIFLGTPAAGVNAAVVDVENDDGGTTGGADITIGGIDYSNASLTRVDVETDGFNFLPAVSATDLTIGGLNIGDLSTAMGLSGDPDKYLILNDFTATSTTDLNDILSSSTSVTTATEIIMATDGDVDLKEMGSTVTTFGVDGVYATSPGTLNLTGAQLAAIGIIDTVNGTDGIADNWVLGPGVNPGDVTINICDLDTTTGVNLNAIAAAGFNIGTITITKDQVLHAGTTLGDADEIVIELGHTADPTISLEMTAAQFESSAGVISEVVIPTPASMTTDYEGQVIVDELEALEEGTTTPTVDIDFSMVTTTGDNTTMLSANAGTGTTVNPTGAATPVADATPVTGGDGDVILTDTSILGNFQVRLNDVDSGVAANELAGHTIRFATVEQADGRVVIVDGPEGADAEQDTNVVWLFTTLGADGTPGLDVSGYDANLGRVWVYDDLVETMVGNNIELLFTIDNPDDPGTPLFTLEEGIIKRIESDDLTDALAVAQPYAQTIEIVSGTGLAGLMAEITDPIIFLEQLQIDLGGLTNNGDLEIDNLIGIDVLGDDDFKTLTLNSFIGDFYTDANNKHYLLPDDFTMPPGALPSDAQQFTDPANVFGDILAGGDRGVLRDIVVNTGVGEYLIDVTADAVLDGDETLTIPWTLGGNAQTPIVVTLTDATDAVLTATEIAAAINALPTAFGIAAQANGAQVVVNDNGSDEFLVTGGALTPGGTFTTLAGAASEPAAGERGTELEAQTIYFSEDDTPETGLGGAPGVGTLDINGVHDVTVKALDFTDAEMIVANLDTAGHTGTFTATGGSAAFTGGATTEKLIITNASSGTGTVLFGGTNGDNPDTAFTEETDFFVPTEVGAQVQAGIDGEALSKIDATLHDGTINLGIVSRIDGTGLNAATTAGFNPLETFNGGFNDGFILDNTGSAGIVILCLGNAENTDDSITFPVLEAGGEWTFLGDGIQLEMKEVTLEGTLNLTMVDLCINGDVSFADLEALVISGGTIEVKAGAKLTLTVEQVDDLEDAGVDISGEGTVVVTGESDSSDAELNTTFGAVLNTATVDLSAVTLDAADDTLEITVTGAEDVDGADLVDENGDRVAQTIIGSVNNDAVTIDGDADDGDDTTIDVITQLGADSGNIGEPNETPSTNTPVDATPEEQGDLIVGGDANVQVETGAGFDTLTGIKTGDVVQVAAGAEFYGTVEGDDLAFVADASSTNDGTAVVEATEEPQTIDVSAAGGAEGWSLIGGPDTTGTGALELTADTVDDGTETYTVSFGYDVGTTGTSGPTLLTADPTDAAAVAAEIAAAINIAFFGDATAVVDGDVIRITDASGDPATFVSITFGGDTDGLSGTFLNGGNILIGSDQDDDTTLVDGSASGAVNDGSEDTHTGNAGEDVFDFNLVTTTPAEFTPNSIQAAADLEYITVLTAAGSNVGTELLTVEYQLNNVTTVAVISDATAGGGDAIVFTDPASIAAGIATVMNGIAGITAVVDGVTPTQVNLVGENGNLLNINMITQGGGAAGFTWDQAGDAVQDDDTTGGPPFNVDDATDLGDDDLQITDALITGTVTAGEVYFLTATLKDGSEIQAQFEAGSEFTTDAAGVVMGLMANSNSTGINDIAAGAVVASISPADGSGETIRITDGDDDDGGFTLTVSEGQAILSASSASSILPGAGGGGELLADQDADIVMDFMEDDDTITFGLDAGSNDNYDEAANEATFADALAAAHDAFANDADLIYYMTGSDDATDGGPVGLLFINANDDDEADTVVQLMGVDSGSFDDSNIV